MDFCREQRQTRKETHSDGNHHPGQPPSMTHMSNNARQKAPPQRLMKILSVFGLFLLIAFPLGMLFVGFSTLEVDCTRKQTGQPPDCEIREIRLSGLFKRQAVVSNVSSIGYKTQDVNTSSRVTLASTVVLTGSNGSFPISQTVSNVGNDWKSAIINKVDRFLKAPDEHNLALHIDERNLFGWIGVAYIALIALSYVFWLVRKVTRGPKPAKNRSCPRWLW
ncbi:MAG: hypothetical protein V1766_00135 [Pseudomonadota bacterium]